MQPGPTVSLKCSASGNPTPKIVWLLDGFPLPNVSKLNKPFILMGTQKLILISIKYIFITFINVLLIDGSSYDWSICNGIW